jgi:hypothetical protein
MQMAVTVGGNDLVRGALETISDGWLFADGRKKN